MRKSIIYSRTLVIICLFLAACSGTKHLPKGEKLYTGAEVKFESTEKMKLRHIKATARRAVRPEPNKSYLGMRPKLWLYMAAGEDPKTGLGKWLKKTGEAPVLISTVKPGISASIIDASLFNIGIFNSYTESKIIEKEHTAKVVYTSFIHKPFTISELTYDVSDDSLSLNIQAAKKKTVIKAGEDYNLSNLSNERMRIDAFLKNKGYFYFNPDYLLFKADTSAKQRTVALQLTLKDSIPENALTVYRINEVFVDQDFSLQADTSGSPADTTRYRNIVFAGKRTEMKIRPRVLARAVYLRKHEVYSRANHTITLNRLMSMGNFKFVQVKFADSDTTASGFLDVDILMTTMPARTFRAEMDIVSKSNDFTGPRMNISLLNRNAFRGAELLNINIAGSFEAQFSGKAKNLYSYSVNPQAELIFPRFILPYRTKSTNSIYVPKTRISLSYQYLKRVDYFDMRTLQFIFGYKWKRNIRLDHEFNPVNLSYTSIGNKSAIFNELLESNPFLKKSYEEQFIAGGNYSYTYNEQFLPLKKTQYYLHATAEAAGNAFSLVKMAGGEKPSPENPSRVIGSIYSQYAKISLDGRGYYNFRNANKLALRIFAGLARPYGNSSVLPYTKQFFSGGPNSIRAFQINSVGPGTYYQEDYNRSFLKLGGEIKFEMNGEYRFTIYRFFKGALFADAGNVWLHKTNMINTGSPFVFSGFMKELAVGAGFGARIDVSFFILRFDLAVPLRKPWLEDNHRWVLNQIQPLKSSWRKENLVLNIAIGYPF